MKYSLILIASVVIFSCGSNEKSSAKVENDSLIQNDTNAIAIDTSTVDSAQTETEIIITKLPASKEFSERLKYFRDQYLVNYSEVEIKDAMIHVLDRHPADKKYKFKLKKKFAVKYGKVENIFPEGIIRAYTYKDSATCANAINNWFNCFGNDCSSIVREEENMIKSTPGFYIINPTSIVCLDYPLEHSENNWESMIKHLKFLLAEKNAQCIRVKPHGKLSWERK
jgi:hypothetical protein